MSGNSIPAAVGELTVGQLSARSGVAVSALRFYEDQGLITARRTAGNQRRYPRVTLRRVAFVRASQSVGIPLSRIREALDGLPADRAPSPADWARLSANWRADLDERIGQLERLRDRLTGCIGCGCLSMSFCKLINPDDALGAQGPGARNLLVRNLLVHGLLVHGHGIAGRIGSAATSDIGRQCGQMWIHRLMYRYLR
jgi:MerR family transcriptional regulator, redox-sensitive transcriptional activator SoxR